MRDKNRIYNFCHQLAYLWATHAEDLRFGQLVSNVFAKIQANGEDPFYLEEGDMIDRLKDYFGLEDGPHVVEEEGKREQS